MDRLPEVVIQRILSFLSPEEGAQSSVLSKTWLRAWSAHPDIVLLQDSICRKLAGGKSYSKQGKKKFAKFVDDTLLRYSKHNLPINKFFLDLTIFDRELAFQLDKWVGMVVNMSVKHLILHINPSTTEYYSLSPLIFASNQLTSLRVLRSRTFQSNKVICFTLKNSVFSSSIIKCCNLKSLFLQSIDLDEWTFQILCSSCPLIEDLSLDECWGMKNIQVSNLRKLVYLSLTYTRNPLQNKLERVHLSSHTLKHLLFYQCVELVEVKIDAPNLLFLMYVANRIPSFSFKFILSEHINSKIEIRPSYDLDTSFFNKFKDMLTKLNQCEFYLDVDISSRNIWFNIEYLRKIPLLPQPKIRRLKIRTSSPSLTYSTIVHGLLWSCHPETLEVYCNSKMDNKFIKFLCKELIIDRSSPKCCSSDQVMCWRHYLNHVEVECSERVTDWNPNDHWNPNHVEEECSERVKDWKLMLQPFDWERLVDGSMFPKYYSAIRFTLNWIH